MRKLLLAAVLVSVSLPASAKDLEKLGSRYLKITNHKEFHQRIHKENDKEEKRSVNTNILGKVNNFVIVKTPDGRVVIRKLNFGGEN